MQTRKSFLVSLMSLGAGIIVFPKLSNLFKSRSSAARPTSMVRKVERASNTVPRKSV